MNKIRSDLWRIGYPILLNMLISQLQIVIDRAFLGQIKVEYMSALGNASAPLWTSIAVIFALTTGATILTSQALGAKNTVRASEISHAALKYNSILSVILFLGWNFGAGAVFQAMGVREPIFSYAVIYVRLISPLVLFTGLGAACTSILQASGYTTPIMISGIVRSLLNIVLDWILIFGNLGFPAMGLEGAAIATSIAEVIGGIILVVLLTVSNKLAFTLSFAGIIRAKFARFMEIVKMGIPSSMEELLWNFGQLGLIRMLNELNQLAAGIYTIIISVDIIPALSFIALGNAALTLTGKATGEGDAVKARTISLVALRHSWLISVAFALIFFLFPVPILRIFTSDADVISGSTILLFIAALNFFPRSANIALGSGIRGYGDTRWMMNTQIFGTVFVMTATAFFLFVLKTGIIGVIIAVLLDETLRAMLNYIRYRKGPKLVPVPGDTETSAA